jgi:thiamine-phosphate pyrophosphorylase
VLRLIDANVDRIGEGLRVLEEVARFLLNDADLCQHLKSLRHQVVKGAPPAEIDLISARDVAGDTGAFTNLPDRSHHNLAALVAANSRRVQESLRVLEESSRLPDSPLRAAPEHFERWRFEVYGLEKQIVSKVLRQEKQSRVRGLYVILDTGVLRGRSEMDVAAGAIRGGAGVIQLRDKIHPRGELIEMAGRLQRLCAEKGVLFIVNDHLDVALASGADGLHVGQEDLPVTEARRLLPFDRLVGCSTHSLAQALQARSDGADYIAVGSIYPTASKEKFEVIGLDMLRRIREQVSMPIVAIGGISCQNLEDVVEVGVDCVAVISAVLQAEDVESAARELAEGMKQA